MIMDDINMSDMAARSNILLRSGHRAARPGQESRAGDSRRWLWGLQHLVIYHEDQGVTSVMSQKLYCKFMGCE